MPQAGNASAAERSEDDSAPTANGPTGQGKTQRSAKACDRCRKSKSKCEPAPVEGEPCKTCATTGAECTYTAPSFRRGPPKGYIQALEHRLHQVESVLAAIMTSTDPRSQSIVDEMSKDELAGYILDTVDAGPFGSTGREKRAIDTTKDNFFSSIVSERPRAQSHRSRRESRATRENVIENVKARDPQIQATRPTLAWQDRLSDRLAISFGGQPSTMHSAMPVNSGSWEEPSGSRSGSSAEPPRTKRRLHAAASDSTAQLKSGACAGGDEDVLDDCADAFGNLSIDENREVRYHGNSCGLQLLVHAERTDGRNIKGIWNFPMAKFWPGPGPDGRLLVNEVNPNMELTVRLPPEHIQDRLLEVYFTYVNPTIPVVDEETFMAQYKAMCCAHPRRYSTPERPAGPPTDENVQPEHPQKISKLLLFAIFAYAATHLEPLERAGRAAAPHEDTETVADAAEYAACARRILDTMYHESRSTTVQALVLLGIREFGIGILEEGWLHIGMAVRMALDLGLNRNPERWVHNGRELFTEKEKEIRKRIWWACCMADKFSAIFLGRTIAIHEGEFSTPLLDIPPDDAEQMWRPSTMDPRYTVVAPVPAVQFAYLRNVSSLCVITGEILAKVYRVSRAYTVPSRELRQQLYQRLLQWAHDLPEQLQYSVKSLRPCPAAPVLVMHVQYWASVLLLHRPFIPKGADLARAGSPSLDPDPVPWESYDICQSAATQVASFAMLYHEKYDVCWAPPLLATCLQAAGYVVPLKYKPSNTQASVGLQKCIATLGGMEVTWTSALRVRHLIQNAKVNIDQAYASVTRPGGNARQKRRAEVAFDGDHMHDTHLPPQPPTLVPAVFTQPPQAHVVPSQSAAPPRGPQSYYAQDDTPRVTPSYDYMPGYDSWWPVGEPRGAVGAGTPEVPAGVAPLQPGASAVRDLSRAASIVPGTVGGTSAGVPASLPSQDFTFGQQHFSPEFLQAMRDPMIHFPSVFAHQPDY
ncbi:fungal-specific transcription factor domain-containing protein [Trametes elegans]|nr:fungal-specific transcription factor domain-containing protein [Trametes elegans]